MYGYEQKGSHNDFTQKGLKDKITYYGYEQEGSYNNFAQKGLKDKTI